MRLDPAQLPPSRDAARSAAEGWTENAEDDVEESVNEQFSVNIITKENSSELAGG